MAENTQAASQTKNDTRRRSPFLPPLVTDVYDPRTGQYLVHCPLWLTAILGILGMAAYSVVGFFDYSGEPKLLRLLSHNGWPLFLWLVALLVLTEAAVLRDRHLRRQLIEMLIVTGVSALLVLATFFYNVSANLVAIVDIVAILIFARWVSHRWMVVLPRLGAPADVDTIDLGFGTIEVERPMSNVEELWSQLHPLQLITGDLFLSTAFASILSILSSPIVLGNMAKAVFDLHNAACALPLAPGNCSVWDMDIALGLAALTAVGFITVFMSTGFHGLWLMARATIGREIAYRIGDRRIPIIRVVFWNGIFALRNLFWPLSVLASVVGLAITARFVERYVHLQGSPPGVSPKDLLTLGILNVAIAFAGGVVAFGGVSLALGLLLFRFQALHNTLYLTGVVTWYARIFLLALSGLNAILWALGVTSLTPFFEPSASSIIAFVAFLGSLLLPYIRRWGGWVQQ